MALFRFNNGEVLYAEQLNAMLDQLDTGMTKHLLEYNGTVIKEGTDTKTYAELYEMLMETTAFVVVIYNGRVFHPNRITSEQLVFISAYVSNALETMDRITVLADNSITFTTGTSEASINKVEHITDANKDSVSKYPSNKAVVEYVGTQTDPIKADLNELVTIDSGDVDVTGTITPNKYIRVKAVDDGTNGASEFSVSNYSHTDFIPVDDVDTITVTARGGNNCPVCVFYSNNALSHTNYVGSSETLTSNKVYNSEVFDIPVGAKYVIVQTNTTTVPIVVRKITDKKITSLKPLVDDVDFAEIVIAERNQFEQLINPLTFKTFDKSYITFTWDDGNAMEAKTVYDLFHEFGMPVNFSLPVSSLSNEYDGQTMLEIAKLAIADGGEVFSHNTSGGIITIDNCTDEFVHKLMKEQKQGLIQNGLSSVRGCMLTGGTGQIVANNYPDTYGKIMDKWVRYYYDFSDLNGLTDQYYKQRSNLNNRLGEGYDAFIQRISNTGWIHFMAHRIDNTSTETNITSSVLRQVLTYISQHSDTIQVVNASYIYDHFSSR